MVPELCTDRVVAVVSPRLRLFRIALAARVHQFGGARKTRCADAESARRVTSRSVV